MNDASSEALPLDEVMLAMDVVDTLRHRQDLVTRELSESDRERSLIDKLRDIYRQQGIEVPDHILKEGVDALAQSRFVYTPPTGGLGVALARIYVSRKLWSRWVAGILLAIIAIFAGYQFGYVPYQKGLADAARIELAELLPARMDALYTTIYEETKVQSAADTADNLRTRGKTAAAEGDRDGAVKIVDQLTEMRDAIRREFSLQIVNRDGEQSGFWTFPEINTDATNYYLVVEALDGDGQALELPIENEETGDTETVSKWGVRVNADIYGSVVADKRDDGIIQRNIVGQKQYGYLDIDYVVPVLGGAVTRW